MNQDARVTFHDHQPETLSLHDAVVEGLSREYKTIPPKFFYDERGSELFDRICRQPEYYVPDVERHMLKTRAEEIARYTGRGRVVIEPGAGNAAKVRLLLNALRPAAYVPMDISGDYLREAASLLAEEFSWLPVHAACVDFTHSLPVPDTAPAGRRLVFFPGSSLGNFDPDAAVKFLCMVRDALGRDGMLLIGVDTKKSKQILNAAYNDAAGVTAQFNLNLLHRIRDELDARCNPENFDHKAFYNDEDGRMEMHLVSRRAQTVRVNGFRFHFREGESVHTENSYKYRPDEFLALAARARLQPVNHWLDARRRFAVYLLRPSEC